MEAIVSKRHDIEPLISAGSGCDKKVAKKVSLENMTPPPPRSLSPLLGDYNQDISINDISGIGGEPGPSTSQSAKTRCKKQRLSMEEEDVSFQTLKILKEMEETRKGEAALREEKQE